MTSTKKGAKPLVRTAKQLAAASAARALPGSAEHAEAMGLPPTAAQQAAARLAQVVNLHIAGYSLQAIGDAIGATADEVDRMLNNDVQRYIKNQPALRIFVRNFISAKYTELLEADWDAATDTMNPDKLDNQDRVIRILKEMSDLHGAKAPVQAEIKVDAAPEAVEALVDALAKAQGLGYDVNVFDTVDAEVIEQASIEAHDAVQQSSDDIEAGGDDEEEL